MSERYKLFFDQCRVTILDASSFYPISWTRWKDLFKPFEGQPNATEVRYYLSNVRYIVNYYI